MMKKRLLTVLVLLLTACGLSGSDPGKVTEKFWSAMQENDLEKARELVTPKSKQEFLSIDDNEIRIDKFELGEVLRGETQSYVMVTVVGPDFNQTFKTALQKVDGKWKVNHRETMGELTRAQIREMGRAFREGMETAGEELAEQFKGMAEALSEGMQEMQEAMEESLPQEGNSAGSTAPGQ